MKVCIGIVTYNNTESQMQRLLSSLNVSYEQARLHHSFELCVHGVDNGEAVMEQALVETALLPVIASAVLPSYGNVGFGTAMNILMTKAFVDCDYFIAVNPDGMFHRNCLNELLNAIVKWGDALFEARQFPEEHPKNYAIDTGNTLWATGACLVIPRQIFAGTGGFDQNLFLYGEDVDICWKARSQGFDVKVVHNAVFIHSTLGRKWSKEAKKHFFLSYVYLAAKWDSPDFQKLYEQEYLTRFTSAEDLELMQKIITTGKREKERMHATHRDNHFAPEFDVSRMLGPARWGY